MNTAQDGTSIDYRGLFDKMTIGIAVHEVVQDANGKAVDVKYLDVNSSYEKILGLKKEEVVGFGARQLFPGLDQKWVDRYEKVVTTGEPVMFEDYLEQKNVYLKVYAFKSAENQFTSVFEDISESKIDQNVQEKERLLLTTLIDSMVDYVFYKNVDGSYLICNDAFARDFVGKSKAEILGRTDSELYGPEDKERLEFILSKDKEVFEKGVEVRVDWETKLANGKRATLETVKTPFKDANGKLLGLVGVSRDITERKNFEQSLNEKMHDLETINKLMVDRELKMVDLKKKIANLEKHGQ